MNTNDTLAHTFALQEQTVPDAGKESDALLARIDRRARRRPFQLAASALAVAGVAATATVALLPADQPHRAQLQIAYAASFRTQTGADGLKKPALTIAAGWLPSGAREFRTVAGLATWGQERQYELDTKEGHYYPSVGVSPDRPKLFDEATKDEHVKEKFSVQGHPAVLTLDGHEVDIYIDRGDDVVATVRNVYDLYITDAQAVRMAKRIATSLSFDADDTVNIQHRLTTAPAGAEIVNVDASYPGQNTFFRLNSSDGGAEVSIGHNPGKYPLPIAGKPGREVQGKPSYITREDGRLVLMVKDLYGEVTKLTAGKGAQTLDDLYLIADGIRAN